MAVATASKTSANGPHGAEELPSVVVTSYNLEIRDADGFLGDKASRSAFMDHLAELRGHLAEAGEDPLADAGKTPSKSEPTSSSPRGRPARRRWCSRRSSVLPSPSPS